MNDPRWFFVWFAGLWAIVCAVISAYGGWAMLANAYPRLESPVGRRRRWVSLGLRPMPFLPPVSYGKCVNLTFAADGMDMSVGFLVRLFHFPIFIPWGEILRTEETRTLLVFRRRSFWFRRTGVRMDVSARLGEEIIQAARESGHDPASGTGISGSARGGG